MISSLSACLHFRYGGAMLEDGGSLLNSSLLGGGTELWTHSSFLPNRQLSKFSVGVYGISQNKIKEFSNFVKVDKKK